MSEPKMKIGMIIRDTLETLVNDPSHDGDYDFLKYLSEKAGYGLEIKDFHEIENVDIAFFLYYPFNRELCENLQKYESIIPFVNKPSGVLKTSEKTYELENWGQYAPQTMLLSKNSYDEISKYINQFDTVVLKPVNGTGGNGIEFFDRPYREDDISSLVELSVNDGRFIIQEYVENDGATRIVCYNGKILGGVKRASQSDRIHNIVRGAKLVEYNPTSKELEIAKHVSEKLIKDGVYLAGLDIVNEKLLEVNTAMPGCLGMVEDVNGAYETVLAETYDIIKSHS